MSCVPAKDAMQDGRSPIIIDNTNLQAWEMKPYVKMVRTQSNFIYGKTQSFKINHNIMTTWYVQITLLQ